MNSALTILLIHQQHPIAELMTQLECKIIMTDKHGDVTQLAEEHQPHVILIEPSCLTKRSLTKLLSLKEQHSNFLPVLLIADREDINLNAISLDVIDDLIWFPTSKAILNKKLSFFRQIQSIRDDLQQKQASIKNYRHLVETEHSIAEDIFENIIRTGTINMPNKRFVLSPMSTFNGDVLLATKTESGILHIALGDFAGHGLPAAIGAMPMAEVFYSMTQKNFKPEDIILEINKKLKELLPINIFCATMYIEINDKKMTMRYWNGGLPDGFLFRPGYGALKTLSSQHLPLGINPSEQVDASMKTIDIKDGDRIYLYTDGLVEAKNPSGETFSTQRVAQIVDDSSAKPERIYDSIRQQLTEFCGSEQQVDDLTLMEFKVVAK